MPGTLAEFAAERDGAVDRPAAPQTFGELAKKYLGKRRHAVQTRKNVTALVACPLDSGGVLGDVALRNLLPAVLIDGALGATNKRGELTCPLIRGRTDQTINRHVITPYNAVVKHGALYEIPLLLAPRREAEKRKRMPATEADALKLLAVSRTAAPNKYSRCKRDFPYRHMLVLTLMLQGWRLSETIKLTWDRVRVDEGTALLYVGKAKRDKSLTMNWAVREMFAKLLIDGERERADRERHGRVFPWVNKDNVRRWWKPFVASFGLTVTPHQLRHLFATQHNKRGSTLADILEAGSWVCVESIQHYIDVDPAHQRTVINRLTYGESAEIVRRNDKNRSISNG